MIVKELTDTNDDRLDKEANTAEWLSNIAQFTALFYRKYWQVDMVGIMNYLLSRMIMDKEFNEIIILKEVISKMIGWSQFNIKESTESQLQCLAGGFGLRLELMSQVNLFKRTQKSSDALYELFWSKTNEKPLSLAFRMMVNLARLTQHIQNNLETDQMMVISTLFDRT